MPVTVLPETEQIVGVVLLKATAKDEVAVALAVVEPPTVKVLGMKLIAPMLWLTLLTVMFCVICEAAA